MVGFFVGIFGSFRVCVYFGSICQIVSASKKSKLLLLICISFNLNNKSHNHELVDCSSYVTLSAACYSRITVLESDRS